MMQRAYILILTMLFTLAAQAQLRLIPDAQPPVVFGGGLRVLEVRWHNSGDAAVNLEISNRLLQASSATVAPLEVVHWKNLTVLPGQTVLESAHVDFPAVKAETEFIVQWLAETNRILGVTRVTVYPTNVLDALRTLLGEGRLGLLDPNGMLKQLLRQNGFQFTDLAEAPLKDFMGRLAIIGPIPPNAPMRAGLTASIKAVTKNGTHVLWFLSPPKKPDQLWPSFYTVMEDTNAVVVAHPGLIFGMPDSPQAQLDLISLCKQTLNPGPLQLPDLTLGN
ncbi:MAG TPA: hypothetical protein VK742_09065 [Candidatus Sulfotelmatobacter sp.]|jgi:hypothetical protein|nr:hypothetical protein [Candidatus Sulfotelmatobacter sp.]